MGAASVGTVVAPLCTSPQQPRMGLPIDDFEALPTADTDTTTIPDGCCQYMLPVPGTQTSNVSVSETPTKCKPAGCWRFRTNLLNLYNHCVEYTET
jgi:hypothetical protein